MEMIHANFKYFTHTLGLYEFTVLESSYELLCRIGVFWHIYHLQKRPCNAEVLLGVGDGDLQKTLLQEMKVPAWA